MTNLYAPIRILLADDHEIFREGFHTLFHKVPDVELLGDAANGEELVKLTLKTKPDIVLTDIKMPVMDGIEATRRILAVQPATYIIALTMFDEDDLIVDMMESGARGYLIKNAHKDEVLEAIKTVHAGDTYFCRQTSQKLTGLIAHSRFNPRKPLEKSVFNEKETEIICLICQEYTNKEISDKLNLSVRTIEGYRERIQQKMNVRNAAGIAVYAIRAGIYKI